MFKWFAGGAGLLIGIAHIGVLGHLMRSNDLPTFIPPQVGERSSYTVEATREGYVITYRGDDPTVMTEQVHSNRPAGFLGTGRSNTTRIREYTESGQSGGAVNEGKLSAEEIACIEAVGGGRSQGAIVGSSVSAGLIAPALSGIPYVGWLAAGWATLFASETAGNFGAEVAQMVEGC